MTGSVRPRIRTASVPSVTKARQVIDVPMSESDAVLVAALKAGRAEAATVLFDRHAKDVERISSPRKVGCLTTNEQIQILGRPWLRVVRHCVTADEDEPNPVADELRQQISEVGVELHVRL